jgi:hypothetical protein
MLCARRGYGTVCVYICVSCVCNLCIFIGNGVGMCVDAQRDVTDDVHTSRIRYFVCVYTFNVCV